MIDTSQPPGLFKRLAVTVYDFLLLIAVLFLATLVLLPFQEGNYFQPNSWEYSVYLCLTSFLFYGWFWTHGGQTLGLMAWKMRVTTDNSQALSWKQALIRFVVAIFSWGLCGLGFIWVLFNKDNLTWHDLASNSRISWKTPN